METKEFDCVRMKEDGAKAVLEELENLTPEQQLDFWKRKTDELRRQVSQSQADEAKRRSA